MPEDEPGQQSPSTPEDPFRPGHAGSMMVLETFRGLREAGGGLVDAAFLTAAFIIANSRAADQP
jgi:hypothetical protein